MHEIEPVLPQLRHGLTSIVFTRDNPKVCDDGVGFNIYSSAEERISCPPCAHRIRHWQFQINALRWAGRDDLGEQQSQREDVEKSRSTIENAKVFITQLEQPIPAALHALQIAKATGCDNVGVAFNLCHFLKVQSGDDLTATLTAAKPLLWSVSICGADADGKDWNTLIRPLDEGTFDQANLLRQLQLIGYQGSIGLQCFNIKIDPQQNLTRSMEAWKKHLTASQEKTKK